MLSQHIKAYILLALAVTIFTGQGLVLKTIMNIPDSYSGLQLSFMRQGLAVLALAPFASIIAWKNRRELWHNRNFILQGALIGFCLHSITSTVGLQYTTALNSYILHALLPIFALVLGALFFGKTLSKHTLFYVILSIIGVMIIITKGHLETLTTLQLNMGDILVISSCIIWAYYGFLMRRKSPEVKFISFIFVGLVLSAIGVFCINALIGDMDFNKDVWTLEFYGLMFYAVIMAQILSLFFYTYATTVLDGVIPAISGNLMPPMGAILAVFILDETFHDYHAMGIVLIGISVYKIVSRDIREKNKKTKHITRLPR